MNKLYSIILSIVGSKRLLSASHGYVRAIEEQCLTIRKMNASLREDSATGKTGKTAINLVQGYRGHWGPIHFYSLQPMARTQYC